MFGVDSCQGMTLRGNGAHFDMTEVYRPLLAFSICKKDLTHMNVRLANVINEFGGTTGLAILPVVPSRKLSVEFLEGTRSAGAEHYGAAMEFTADFPMSLRPEGLTTTVWISMLTITCAFAR